MEFKSQGSVLSQVMKYVVPLVITVGLCWLMFHNIDFHEMVTIIRTQCNFTFIGIALVVSIFSHIFRALRWNIQLQALGVNAPKFVLVLSIFGTYAINLVFPRLGEVWRTGYIANRQKAPFSTVFGSMVADRLADTVTVLLLLIVTFFLASSHLLSYLSQNQATYDKVMALLTSPWLWIAGVACIAVVWWMLTRKSAEGSFLYKLQQFVKGLWKGFAVIATMKGKGMWLLYTFCIWGCYFFQLYIAFYAFPFTADVLSQYGIIVALLTFALSSVAMGVPSNGGIGPWQWSVICARILYSVNTADSTAFANLVLGMQTLLLILLGLFTFVCIMLMKKKAEA